MCFNGVQVEGKAVNKGLVVDEQEEYLKRNTKNFYGRAIMRIRMSTQNLD